MAVTGRSGVVYDDAYAAEEHRMWCEKRARDERQIISQYGSWKAYREHQAREIARGRAWRATWLARRAAAKRRWRRSMMNCAVPRPRRRTMSAGRPRGRRSHARRTVATLAASSDDGPAAEPPGRRQREAVVAW